MSVFKQDTPTSQRSWCAHFPKDKRQTEQQKTSGGGGERNKEQGTKKGGKG
jgi:hypothetical protein